MIVPQILVFVFILVAYLIGCDVPKSLNTNF
jgi:hypothetical protein